MDSNYYSDKCFVNGEVRDFATLDPLYKEPREVGRYSFTDLAMISTCPYMFVNSSWEDIGLSESDSSAHGVIGHFLMTEYIRLCMTSPEFSLRDFNEQAMQLAQVCITYQSNQARAKINSAFGIINAEKFKKMFVTPSFNMEKYLDKVSGYLRYLNEIFYLIGRDCVNIYVETGIYKDINGNVVFGKADLLIEHKDGTFTVVDHKSSFNLMYFHGKQLPLYGMLLGRPIRNLVIHELSSGGSYFYSDVQAKIMESYSFVSNALKGLEGEIVTKPGEHCTGCTIDCIGSQTDDDGYLSI